MLQTASHKITHDTLFSSTGHHIDKEELLIEVKSLEEGMRTNQFDERDDRISKFVKEKLWWNRFEKVLQDVLETWGQTVECLILSIFFWLFLKLFKVQKD